MGVARIFSGTTRFENSENDFLKKLGKMQYFGIFFQRNLQTLRYIFARLDEKPKLLGNFEKIFENFQKFS